MSVQNKNGTTNQISMYSIILCSAPHTLTTGDVKWKTFIFNTVGLFKPERLRKKCSQLAFIGTEPANAYKISPVLVLAFYLPILIVWRLL